MRHRTSLSALAVLAALPPARPAHAQNPVASKVVGSSFAAENRRLLRRYADRESGRIAGVRATAPDSAAGRAVAEEVSAITIRYGQPRTAAQTARAAPARGCVARALEVDSTGAPRLAVRLLDSLCAVPSLEPVVHQAITLELRKLRRRQPAEFEALRRATVDTSASVALLSARALDRVLRAEERGRTNPQRWYLGGQLGLRLFGDADPGALARASARASYFVPVSPLRRWQLPVVTNLRDIADAEREEQGSKLKAVTTSSEGAYLSVEPTWDPVFLGDTRDVRLQPFAAVGAQLNTLRDHADTRDVAFGQGRFALGSNLEFGSRSSGQTGLFLTSRLVLSAFGPGTHAQVFGRRDRARTIWESYAIIPIGGSTGIMAEASAARGVAPVIRIGLWSQATGQTATPAAQTTP